MRAVLCVALAACSFPRATEQLECVTTDDCDDDRFCTGGFCVTGAEPPDGPTDSAGFDCTQWTPAPAHFDPCAIPQPAGALELTSNGVYTYDTSTGTLTDPDGNPTTPTNQLTNGARLISVDRFSIPDGVTLRMVGEAPLIVASWADIDVTGVIDASTTTAGAEPGAGSGSADCAMHAPTPGTANGGGGGGGGGGSYQGPGGNGGDGDGGGNGVGGDTVADVPLLLGGCPGATGGNGDSAGGPGGGGGGAFQLTAQGAITIRGVLSAGGAGGARGVQNDDGGGGGGGGSGGMIGLQGASIAIESGATLAANGGGGGEGGDDDPGLAGADANVSDQRALGGDLNEAGNGGNGSAAAALNGLVGGNDNGQGGGGGGGGGGAGFIVFRSPAPATKGTVVISPPETLIP